MITFFKKSIPVIFTPNIVTVELPKGLPIEFYLCFKYYHLSNLQIVMFFIYSFKYFLPMSVADELCLQFDKMCPNMGHEKFYSYDLLKPNQF